MASTVFTDFVTSVPAAWLNDVNTATYVTVPTTLPASVTAETNARIAADAALLVNTAMTGTPTAPTAALGTSTTQVSTTAFATSQDLGVGQTWQNLTSSRAFGGVYTNATAKPIFVAVGASVAANLTVAVAGAAGAAMPYVAHFIVPTGATYSVTTSAGTVFAWNELR